MLQQAGDRGGEEDKAVLSFGGAAGPGADPAAGLAEADLLRALAHDIRSPLTAIAGAVEAALVAGELSPALRELLQGAAGEAQNLLSLAENILALSRLPGAGQGPVAAEEAMSAAMALFGQRHPALALSAHVTEQPIWLAADGVLVRQVLLNLLENAACHGADALAMEVVPAEQQAIITVRDNGPGLAPELLSRLFQDSAQASGSGMGLGLCICRRIVAGLGGRIWAENNPDNGAAFSFALNRVEVGDDK